MKFALILFAFFLLSCGFTRDITSDVHDAAEAMTDDTISVCSFNIQFLGHFKNRDNELLAQILDPFDLVIIQEMVAPPVEGQYPDGSFYSEDVESKAFHQLMLKEGFSYWLSNEDTGPTKNHVASSASEWWVAYYRPETLLPDSVERNYGFLDDKLVANEHFDRVPYAFPFRSVEGELDFTIISVHLAPGGSSADKNRREVELTAISSWIREQEDVNKDFIIAGDCNIENKTELQKLLTTLNWYGEEGVFSLNSACISTNTKRYESSSKGKPYDQVFYDLPTEEDLVSGFEVVDLLTKTPEGKDTNYIYEHNSFRTLYSDHLPISFQLLTGKDTD